MCLSSFSLRFINLHAFPRRFEHLRRCRLVGDDHHNTRAGHTSLPKPAAGAAQVTIGSFSAAGDDPLEVGTWEPRAPRPNMA